MRNLLLKFAPLQKRHILLGLTILPSFALQFPGFSSQIALGASCPRLASFDAVGMAIAQKLEQPHLRRTRWGIDIRRVSEDGAEWTSIYSKNAEELFLPASTAKLFTTAAVVARFDADYRIETPYFSIGRPPVIQQLRVQGTGDPSILDPQLRQVGQTLKAQGVKTIETLVGDSRAFGMPAVVPSWEWADLQSSDGVPITSLSFSQNSLPLRLSPAQEGQPLRLEWLDGRNQPPLQIENRSKTVSQKDPEYLSLDRSLLGDRLTIRGQLQVGAEPDLSYVAIANPTAYFLHRLKLVLRSEGIKVKRLVVQNSDTSDVLTPKIMKGEKRLGAIASPPLSEMLKEVNQSSNNFYTESLLRHFAWSQTVRAEPQEPVTLGQSVDALQTTLSDLGLDADAYRLKDASGLSRQNLVSPESLTSTLVAMLKWQSSNHDKFRLFKDSLAIAGQSGTLKRRFTNTPVEGKLFAKTGTLSGTVTLAGLLQEPGQSPIVMSLMANHSDQSTATLRNVIDEIVQDLHQAQTCLQNSPG